MNSQTSRDFLKNRWLTLVQRQKRGKRKKKRIEKRETGQNNMVKMNPDILIVRINETNSGKWRQRYSECIKNSNMLYTTDTDETTECCVDGYESSDIEYKKWEFCQ